MDITLNTPEVSFLSSPASSVENIPTWSPYEASPCEAPDGVNSQSQRGNVFDVPGHLTEYEWFLLCELSQYLPYLAKS